MPHACGMAGMAFWRLFLHGISNYIGFDMVISDIQPLMRAWNAVVMRVSLRHYHARHSGAYSCEERHGNAHKPSARPSIAAWQLRRIKAHQQAQSGVYSWHNAPIECVLCRKVLFSPKWRARFTHKFTCRQEKTLAFCRAQW